MNTLRRVSWLVAVAIALLALLGAPRSAAAAAAPETLSTGVSAAERVPRKDYSLLLMFAEAKGPYLANVAVEIKDEAGKVVLTTTSEGPWLFVKLPAGTYKVLATRTSGERTGATFTVGLERQQLVRLTW